LLRRNAWKNRDCSSSSGGQTSRAHRPVLRDRDPRRPIEQVEFLCVPADQRFGQPLGLGDLEAAARQAGHDQRFPERHDPAELVKNLPVRQGLAPGGPQGGR
jgi:hypothetical protein